MCYEVRRQHHHGFISPLNAVCVCVCVGISRLFFFLNDKTTHVSTWKLHSPPGHTRGPPTAVAQYRKMAIKCRAAPLLDPCEPVYTHSGKYLYSNERWMRKVTAQDVLEGLVLVRGGVSVNKEGSFPFSYELNVIPV